MPCEYCKSGEKTICYSDTWEGGFVRTNIRFYAGNNDRLYLGADALTENGKQYSTCFPVMYCPMCGEATGNSNPLLPEQLRKMEGKPVWIECTEEYNNAQKWEIVCFNRDPDIRNEHHPFPHAPLTMKEYGVTWWAFTHERKQTA